MRIGVDVEIRRQLCCTCSVAVAVLLGATMSLVRVADAAEPLAQWPNWRGPLSTGEAPQADPPTEWNESKNIRWKTALPGLGHSSPVVWDDRIFVTTAVPVGDALPPRPSMAPGAHDNLPVTHQQQFVVLAADRENGAIVWQRSVGELLPHETWHVSGSAASASPVTDGEHVFAFFGSYGLSCLDLEGTVVWQKDLGDMLVKHGHGEGASPALHDETLVVNWDHEGDSFLVAFDKRTGEERWRAARDEVTSWATPIVVEQDGRAQVIVSGTGRVRGYDLDTGDVIWECGGLSNNVVASPVAADGMLYAGSSYDTRAMLAIRLSGAMGDITGSDHVVWTRSERTPYVPSPLLYDNALYYLYHYQGVLTRLEAETGEEPSGPFRLPGITDVYASPVAAAGRIYITDREGATLVMTAGQQPQALALNRLEEPISATPALVGKEIILRGEHHLYSISQGAQ